MRAYVITTGAVFGLLTVAHVLRILTETAALARDPFYVGITLASATLCGWAAYVLLRRPRPSS
jgi:hypothetical protein